MATATAIEVMPELEQESQSLATQARSIQVVDQESYDLAAERLLAIKDLRRKSEEHHRPVIDAAHRAHKAALAALQRIDGPLAEAEGILKSSIGSYEIQQRRIQEQREREAREAAQRAQDELLEAQIEQAEAAGAGTEEIEAIIDAPLVAPRPYVPPMHMQAAGVSAREIYSAEVFDMKALCREIAEGRQPAALVSANMTALNSMARSLKTALKIPGVRVTSRASVSAGRR